MGEGAGCFEYLALLILPLGLLAAVFTAVSIRTSSKVPPEGWISAAKALNGRFEPATWSQHARIDFLASGRSAFLHFIPGRTAVRVNVRGLSPGYLTLTSTYSFRHAAEESDFHQLFDFEARPDSLAQHLLTSARKQVLTVLLEKLRKHRSAKMELGKYDLSLEVGASPKESNALLELVDVTRDVLDCLLGIASSIPLQLVDVPNPESARCRICGSELLERIVRCMSCSTPHHEDCWRFNGRCSTYGCGDSRFSNRGT